MHIRFDPTRENVLSRAFADDGTSWYAHLFHAEQQRLRILHLPAFEDDIPCVDKTTLCAGDVHENTRMRFLGVLEKHNSQMHSLNEKL